MKANILVLGATGGIGYGLVKTLLRDDVSTAILVRDVERAFELFGNHPRLEVIKGDVLDSELLRRVTRGRKYVFHGVNASYERWESFLPAATRNVIDAAEAAQATVVFPGNVYNYGLISEPATEITPFRPSGVLGNVRVDVENMLKTASDLGRIKTLVVRLPEVWGPNVTNDSFAPVFENALRRKPVPWPYTTAVPQQMIWNMDAGRAIAALMDRDAGERFEVFHVGGRRLESMASFFDGIGEHIGAPVRQRVVGRKTLRLLGLVKPVLRRVSELEYRYRNTILLDDAKFRRAVPDFEETPIDTALRETLEWFRTRRVEPAQDAKKKRRVRNAIDFVSDNAAIVLFPLIIALIGSSVSFVGKNAVLFGVVAGIYWAPAVRAVGRRLGSGVLRWAAVVLFSALAVPTADAQNVRSGVWNETQVHVSVGLSAPVLHGGAALMDAKAIRRSGQSYFEGMEVERRSVGGYSALVGWGFELGFHRPSGLMDRLMLGASAAVSLTGSTPSSGGYAEGYFFNAIRTGLAWKYYPARAERIALKGDVGLSSAFTKNRYRDGSGEQAFHHQFGIGAGASLGLAWNVAGPWSLDLTHALSAVRVEVNGRGDDAWTFGTTSLMIQYRF